MRLQSAIFTLGDTLFTPDGAAREGLDKALSLFKMEGVWLGAVTALSAEDAQKALEKAGLHSYFRFVLTEEFANGGTQNSLVILDGNLKETGKIENIAKNEKVYSVRFMGDVAYFVTFRQVDPLFSVDVSDPTSPKIIGSLKIPGFSDYLFPYGEGKLLGVGRSADETTGRVNGMKLSLFDISNPANVTESFKTVVGNTYSEALTNHKATLADAEKNLIAFPYNDEKGTKYLIYSLESTGFALKAEIPLGGDTSTWGTCRGLYIGKLFYAVSDKEIAVIDMQNFQKITELKIK